MEAVGFSERNKVANFIVAMAKFNESGYKLLTRPPYYPNSEWAGGSKFGSKDEIIAERKINFEDRDEVYGAQRLRCEKTLICQTVCV